MKEPWIEEAEKKARGIRLRVLEHVVENNGGYLSQACSAAEIFAALYVKLLNIGPSLGQMIPPPFEDVPGAHNPHYQTGAVYNGPMTAEFDRFIFSPSHYALVLYAALVEVGRMAPEGLAMFNQDGGVVEMIGAEHSPGIETTTGSLGQALSQAGGIALARKLRGDTGRVFVFMTDGELQEGQTWEAFQTIRHYNLDNMVIIFDMNYQQCDGAMEDVMTIGSVADKLTSFGAKAVEVSGHDLEALVDAVENTQNEGMPLVVLANTNPCQGMDILKPRLPRLHYVRFTDAEEKERFREVLQKWKS